MQWEEKELDTHFTPRVYFWTPNSEILAKALLWTEVELGTEFGPTYLPDSVLFRNVVKKGTLKAIVRDTWTASSHWFFCK